MINSFLLEGSQTPNSWKRIAMENRIQERFVSIPSTGFVTHILVVKRACSLGRSVSKSLVVIDSPSNSWIQDVAIILTSRYLPWKENRNSTDGAAFSDPCGCHEISSFPLSWAERLPLQLFMS